MWIESRFVSPWQRQIQAVRRDPIMGTSYAKTAPSEISRKTWPGPRISDVFTGQNPAMPGWMDRGLAKNLPG